MRYHRSYQALLCIGIAPEDILFNAWSKADVSTMKAGHLVTLDKGSSATFKLTKTRNELLSIVDFSGHIETMINKLYATD